MLGGESRGLVDSYTEPMNPTPVLILAALTLSPLPFSLNFLSSSLPFFPFRSPLDPSPNSNLRHRFRDTATYSLKLSIGNCGQTAAVRLVTWLSYMTA